jgi:lipopolysaccharide export system permease protein
VTGARTVTRYVSRLFIARFLACLGGFVGLVVLLDLLDNATEMIERGGLSGLGVYAGLRLPLVALQLVPIATLVAALITLTRLGHTLEIVACKAAGLSFYRVLLALMPVAFVIGLGLFMLGDVVAPPADRALRLWLERTALPDQDPSDRVWLRRPGMVLAFDSVAPDGALLNGVTIVERDPEGRLVARTTAQAAEHGASGWTLRDAVRESADGQVARLATQSWTTNLKPDDLAGLAEPQQSYALGELGGLIADKRVGTRTRNFYLAQWHKKLAAPAACALMVLIAAPVAQGVRGRAGSFSRFGLGLIVAFAYFVTDGLTQVMSEAGVLAPALGAWAPTLLFATVAAAFLVFSEG